jgi:hypothetical protein
MCVSRSLRRCSGLVGDAGFHGLPSSQPELIAAQAAGRTTFDVGQNFGVEQADEIVGLQLVVVVEAGT